MSNLVDHARRELALVETGPDGDRAFADSLLRAVEGFASYPGHSGGSAMVAIEWLTDLLHFRNLSPLTDEPAEWNDLTGNMISNEPLWQSSRNSAAFSDDGGKTYWLTSEGASVHDRNPCHPTLHKEV